MPLLTLVAQSVAMFAASFGIGYLPLAFKSVMSGKSYLIQYGQLRALVYSFNASIIPRQAAQGHFRLRYGLASWSGADGNHTRVGPVWTGYTGIHTDYSDYLYPHRGVDMLYDSLPENKEGLADTSTTIGISLLTGFALMLL
jgi:hypothetical protein